MRFFRFHAFFGDPAEGIDADGLSACAELADGLIHVSKERVGTEMAKLLSAPDPGPSVAAMRQAGVLARILPGANDQLLAPLLFLEKGESPSFLRRLAVLGGSDTATALRLSKSDARLLDLLRLEMAQLSQAKELGYRYGTGIGRDILLLRGALSNEAPTEQDIDNLSLGRDAIFPISASDLMPDFTGPALGQKLKELEKKWIASGFMMTKSDLMQ